MPDLLRHLYEVDSHSGAIRLLGTIERETTRMYHVRLADSPYTTRYRKAEDRLAVTPSMDVKALVKGASAPFAADLRAAAEAVHEAEAHLSTLKRRRQRAVLAALEGGGS